MSTVAWAHSDRTLQRCRTKGAPCRRQSSGRPPEHSRPSLNLSQHKRLLSHGVTRTKDGDTEEENFDFDLRKEIETDDDYIHFWAGERADTRTQEQPGRFDITHRHGIGTITPPSNHAATYVDTPEEFPRQSFPSWRDPEEDKHLSTSGLYQRVLGSYGWAKAVDAVAPYSRFSKATKDTSRDQTDIDSVAELVRTLWGESNPSTQYLFRLYRELPSPGMAVLSKRTRGALLRLFAHPRDRRWVDARRYLALVDDMVTANLPISRSLWSSAIHLAGRANGKVVRRDLIRAIGVWQKMEHVAGVKADEVVFNILFDIAIKAGAFQVASRLEQEMTGRGMGFSRCGKVSQIFYFGLMQDADGVRAVFDDFIASGEIVDTVVMNCLIASFLRAGETQTAEQLYAQMLEQQNRQSKSASPSGDGTFHIGDSNLSYNMSEYRHRARRLGRVLKKSAALRENFPEYHRALQSSLCMTPDTRTFHVFLRHYALDTGQLDSFIAVMRDMENTYEVPPRAIIYLLLFEGFALHGRRKKQWSAENLRLTWHAYIRALRDSHARLRGLYLNNRKMTWENPLAKSVETDLVEDVPLTDTPDGFYMHLPSAGVVGKPELGTDETPDHLTSTTNPCDDDQSKTSKLGEEDDISNVDDADVDSDEVIGADCDSPEAEQTPWDPEKRIENGVFIGRRMIIVILQAFGTCCGPKEVLEVWLQLERLWHPSQRRAMDVFAIKEELDKQMSRSPRRNR